MAQSKRGRGTRRNTLWVVLTCGAFLASCSPVIHNHGYIPLDRELRQIDVGVATRDTVAELVGQPTTLGVMGEAGWYFVGSKMRHYAYRRPEEIEREIVAISFTPDGVVQNVERFGLDRGRVVTLSRRVTEIPVQNSTFIRQIIRNFGQFDAAQTLDRPN